MPVPPISIPVGDIARGAGRLLERGARWLFPNTTRILEQAQETRELSPEQRQIRRTQLRTQLEVAAGYFPSVAEAIKGEKRAYQWDIQQAAMAGRPLPQPPLIISSLVEPPGKFAGIEGPSTEDFLRRLQVMHRGNEIPVKEVNRRLYERITQDLYGTQVQSFAAGLQRQINSGRIPLEQAQKKLNEYLGQIYPSITQRVHAVQETVAKEAGEARRATEPAVLTRLTPEQRLEQQSLQAASFLGHVFSGERVEPSLIEQWRSLQPTEITPEEEKDWLERAVNEIPALIEQYREPTTAALAWVKTNPDVAFSVSPQSWQSRTLRLAPSTKEALHLVTRVAQRARNETISRDEIKLMQRLEKRMRREEPPHTLETAVGGVYALFGGELLHGTAAAIQRGEPAGEVVKTALRGVARMTIPGVVGSFISRSPAWSEATGASEWIEPILNQRDMTLGRAGKISADIALDPIWAAGFALRPVALAAQVGARAARMAGVTAQAAEAAGKISRAAVPALRTLGREAFMQNWTRWRDVIHEPRLLRNAIERGAPERFLNDVDEVLGLIDARSPILSELRGAGVTDDIIRDVVSQTMHLADDLPHTPAAVISLVPKYVPMPLGRRPHLILGGLRAKSIADWGQMTFRQSQRLSKFKHPLIAAFNHLTSPFGNVPVELWDTVRINEDIGRMIYQTWDTEARSLLRNFSANERELITLVRQLPRILPDPVMRSRYLELIHQGKNPWLTEFAGARGAAGYAKSLPDRLLHAAQDMSLEKWDRFNEALWALDDVYDLAAGKIVEHNFLHDVIHRADTGDFTVEGLYAGRRGLRFPSIGKLDLTVAKIERLRANYLAEAERKIADRTRMVEQARMEPTAVMQRRLGAIEGQRKVFERDMAKLKVLSEDELTALRYENEMAENVLADAVEHGGFRRNIGELNEAQKRLRNLRGLRDVAQPSRMRRWTEREIKAEEARIAQIQKWMTQTIRTPTARRLLADLQRNRVRLANAEQAAADFERLEKQISLLTEKENLWKSIQEARVLTIPEAAKRIRADVMNAPLLFKRLNKIERALAKNETLRAEAVGREQFMKRAQEIWENDAIPWQVKPLKLRDEFHYYTEDVGLPSAVWDVAGAPALSRFKQTAYVPFLLKERIGAPSFFSNMWNRFAGRRYATVESPRKYRTVEQMIASDLDPILDMEILTKSYGRKVSSKISRVEMLRSFRRSAGVKPYPGMERDGYILLPDNAPSELKPLAYPKATYDAFVELADVTPRTAAEYSQMFRDVSRIIAWPAKQLRVLYTAARVPDYQLRNMLSDSVQMYLGGFRNPAYHLEAMKVMRLVARERAALGHEAMDLGERWITRQGKRLRFTNMTDRDVARQVIRYAIESGGPMEREVGYAIGKAIRFYNPLDIVGRGSQLLETERRVAFFIDRLAKGMSPPQAADDVARFLYRFGELSAFEKTTMRSLVFFYSWYRKNLAFQMYAALAHPEQWAAVRALAITAKKLFPEARQLSDDEIPDWIRKYYSIPLPPEISDRIYEMAVARGIPVAPDQEFAMNLTTAVQDIGQYDGLAALLSNINPILIGVVERAFNRKLYTGMEIDDLDHVQMPSYWMAFPRWLRNFIGADIEWPPGTENMVGFSMARWKRDLIYGILAPLRMGDRIWERWNPSGVTPVVSAQGWLDASFNYPTGLRLRTWSPTAERERDKRQLATTIDELRRFMIGQGYFGPAEEWEPMQLGEGATPYEILQQYPAPPGTENMDWQMKAGAAMLYNKKPPYGTPYTVFEGYTTDTSMDIFPVQLDLQVPAHLKNFIEAAAQNGFQATLIGIGGAAGDGGPARIHLEFTGLPGPGRPTRPGPPRRPQPSQAPQAPTEIAPFLPAPAVLRETPSGPPAQAAAAPYQWAIDLGNAMRREGLESNIGTLVATSSHRFLGVKYSYGSTNPQTGLDCSGFVWNVFRDLGMEMPRTSQQQWKVGFEVPIDEVQPGDLVFFDFRNGKPHHVGIMDTEGYFVHSSRGRGFTKREKLGTYGLPARARRVIQ